MGLRKHGPLFRTLIWLALAALLCCHALGALLLGGAPETVRASVCKVGDGLTVSGFVVFSERAVGTAQCRPALATGKRVAAGACAAWRCEAGQEALCAKKRWLSERREALTAPTAGSDAEIKAALHRLSLAPSQEAAQSLQMQILRREAVAADPVELRQAVQALYEQEREVELTAVNAPESGCFAYKPPSICTPEALLGLSPGELASRKPSAEAACRLITGEQWYFAALLPEERELLPGQRLTVRFPALTVEMTVERFCTAPEGRLLVLSCREKLSEAAALCAVAARLQFSLCEGLRVPKPAVQFRDGRTGVDVLVAGQKKFKPVTLVLEREDDFLAAPTPGDPNALQAGDEMVIGQ